MKDQCKQAIAQALGKSTIPQEEAQRIEQRVNEAMRNRAKQDRQAWRNLSLSERLKEAADQVAIDIKADLIRKRDIVARDIVVTHEKLSMLTDNRNKLSAMERVDRMIDFYGDLSGIQSVNRHSISIATDYKGRLYEFYKKINGITRLIQDDVLANNIIRERFGENTGDKLAKQISDEIGRVADDMRDRFNRNGGDIGKLEGWGLWTAWDSVKTFSKGVDRFIQLGLKNIKRDEYVHEDGTYFNEQELTDLLRESWVTIKSEGANKNEVGKANFSGNSKITNRHSESRVLHWKDADAWIEMQKEFGNKSLFEIIDSNVSRMSKDIALVEYFGSNPTATFKMLLDSAAKIDSGDGVVQSFLTKMRRSRAEDMFNEFTGQIGIGHEVVANLWRGYRSLNSGAMLGGTTLTTTTDHATMVKMANAHGLSIQKFYEQELSLLNPANTADREFALYLGFGISELTSSVSRFADEGLTEAYGLAATFAKVMDAAASTVLRVSGLTAITQIRKQTFDILMGAKYADMTRTKAWKDLDDVDREWFTRTGLTERAWQVMQLAEPKQMPDSKINVLSIRSIYEIPDDKLLAAMDSDVKTLMDDINSQVKALDDANALDHQRIANKAQRTDDIKRQLSQRLLDYANRKDSKAQAEKQALQDRIDLLDAQNEYAAAQADMNTYIRNMNNKDDLKGFMDDITQGRTIDNIAANAEKLGRNLEALDNKVAVQTKKLNDKIKTFEKEIQGEFSDFTELLDGKTKLSKEKLAIYEDKLAERLNRYASRRDVITAKQLDALNALKEIVGLKQEQLKTEFEIKKATTQTKIKQKTDHKIDQSLERNTRRDYQSGENIGRRLGNSERRMTELRGKIRKADSEANKAIQQKFKELDKKVTQLDDEFTQYQTKVDERQQRRQHVIDRLKNGIDGNKKALAKKIREEVATQFQTHLLDEQGMAIIESGLRERTKFTGGTKAGTFAGEALRLATQFKSFPLAMLMRHGSRAFAQEGFKGKAAYAIPLITGLTILGGVSLLLKDIAKGENPSEVWDGENPYLLGLDADFLKRSFVAGGGLPIIGDIIATGNDPLGRNTEGLMTGPIGGDFRTLLGLTVGNAAQWYEGKDTNAANEAYRFAKGKIPGQNLWYTKTAVDRLIFDDFQKTLAPDYQRRQQQRMRKQGRSQWWKQNGDIEAPDFSGVVK